MPWLSFVNKRGWENCYSSKCIEPKAKITGEYLSNEGGKIAIRRNNPGVGTYIKQSEFYLAIKKILRYFVYSFNRLNRQRPSQACQISETNSSVKNFPTRIVGSNLHVYLH